MAHFADDADDETVKIKGSLGLPMKFKLKDGAVPSVKAPTMSVGHVADGQSSLDDGEREARESPHQVNPRQSGGAFLKRERAWVNLLK